MEVVSSCRRYRFVTHNGQRVREHRLIMAGMIGRPLRSDECVHHINGDGLDNRPENLQIMSASEHLQLHAALRNGPIRGFSPVKDEMLARLRERPQRFGELKAALGVSDAQTFNTLKRMMKQGLIERIAPGLYRATTGDGSAVAPE